MFFRRVVIHVVIFSERNLAGSKVFSHASAPRDYMSLPTFTGSKVIPPCTTRLSALFLLGKDRGILTIAQDMSKNKTLAPGGGALFPKNLSKIILITSWRQFKSLWCHSHAISISKRKLLSSAVM